MSGASSRRKGHTFERQVACRLRPIFGDSVRRGLQYQDGAHCSDVIVPGYHIECKAHKSVNIKAAMRQAVEDCNGSGKVPVAVTKDDREYPLVTMYLNDFEQLLAELNSLRSKLQDVCK